MYLNPLSPRQKRRCCKRTYTHYALLVSPRSCKGKCLKFIHNAENLSRRQQKWEKFKSKKQTERTKIPFCATVSAGRANAKLPRKLLTGNKRRMLRATHFSDNMCNAATMITFNYIQMTAQREFAMTVCHSRSFSPRSRCLLLLCGQVQLVAVLVIRRAWNMRIMHEWQPWTPHYWHTNKCPCVCGLRWARARVQCTPAWIEAQLKPYA